MTNASKFEFFQKHKVDGLQNIVGGMYPTYVKESTNPNWVGHGDTFYTSEEHDKTSRESDPNGQNKGDLVVAITEPGDPNPVYVDAEPMTVSFVPAER